MKLRSRGLGRRELVMDFRQYDIARDGDDVVVSGTIRDPVTWDFTIRISGDDIPGMLRIGLHRHTLSLAARWVLHTRHKASPVPESAPAPLGPAVRARPAKLRGLPVEGEPGDAVGEGSESPGAEPAPAPITRLHRAVVPQDTSTVPTSADGGRPVSTIRRTPDFGVPRRRGGVPATAPPARVLAEGGGR